ncbi:MAG TPA: O-antigen ligase family protein [Coleofasciculaceae cyanobacterium]
MANSNLDDSRRFMMTDWNTLWLVAGIVLTTATQLRVAGGSIGPGEVMLAIWILLAIGRVLIAQCHLMSPLVKAVLLFWIACCLALALGTAIASSQGIIAVEADLQHNMQALIFASAFSLVFTISFTSVQKIKQGLVYFTALITIPLGILFFFPSILPFINSQYGNVRFSGWSLNPNQTALSLLFIPFFSLYLLKESQDTFGKIWYGLLAAVSIFLGIATRSDALSFAWDIGAICLVIFGIDRVFLNILINNIHFSVRLNIYRLLIRLLLLAIALLSLPVVYYAVSSTAVEVYDDGGQGSDRLRLWANGIAAFSHSPIFGLGPGSHSGEIGPFLSQECHNTFIDWLTNAGSVGLISYIVLLAWIGWMTWRKGSPILLAAVIASVGFASFHYVLRQSLYWFCLLTIAEITLFSSDNHRRLLNQMMDPERDDQEGIATPVVLTKGLRSTGSHSV